MEDENNFAVLGTAITSLIGSILAIIGFIIPYYKYPNLPDHPGHAWLTNLFLYDGDYYQYVSALDLVIFIIMIIVAIISILAIIGSLLPKIGHFANTKLLCFILALFILLPISAPYEYLSPLLTIAYYLTLTSSNVAYYSMVDPLNPSVQEFAAGFYLEVIGICLMLVAFLITIILVFSKKTDENYIRESSDNSANSGFNITTAILSIIASIGIILGLALPYYRWVYRTGTGENRNPALLLPERTYFDGFETFYTAYIDYAALFYMIIALFILVAAILLLISSFGGSIRASKKSMFLMAFLLMIVPIYGPANGVGLLWFPPFMEIIAETSWLFDDVKIDKLQYADSLIDEKLTLSFGGVYLYIAIFLMLLVLVLVLSGFAYKKLLKKASEY